VSVTIAYCISAVSSRACVTERFLSNYQSLDESLAVIMAKINEKSNKTPGKSFMTAMTSDPAEDLTTVAIPTRE